MEVQPIIQNNKYYNSVDFTAPTTVLPVGERKYSVFNQNKVEFIVSQKEHALPYIKDVLQNSKDENEIVEALYITDKLVDVDTKGVKNLYPSLAKYNYSESPNIQTLLAGIYRKTQVPDAFGPLVVMLIRNAKQETTQKSFDPNEEIGGAILEYMSNYSDKAKTIDYNA